MFLISFDDYGAVLSRLDDRLVVYQSKFACGEGCCEVYSVVESLHHVEFI